MSKIKIQLASAPDREQLVAPLMVDNEQWGEIDQESGQLRIEIYPCRDGRPWVFDLDDLLEALSKARQRLLGETN